MAGHSQKNTTLTTTLAGVYCRHCPERLFSPWRELPPLRVAKWQASIFATDFVAPRLKCFAMYPAFGMHAPKSPPSFSTYMIDHFRWRIISPPWAAAILAMATIAHVKMSVRQETVPCSVQYVICLTLVSLSACLRFFRCWLTDVCRWAIYNYSRLTRHFRSYHRKTYSLHACRRILSPNPLFILTKVVKNTPCSTENIDLVWVYGCSFNFFFTVTCMTFVHEPFCSSLQRINSIYTFTRTAGWHLLYPYTQHSWSDLLLYV